MKYFSLLSLIVLLLVACGDKTSKNKCVVTIKKGASQEFIFQPEGNSYVKDTTDATGNYIFELDLRRPAYYQYVDSKSNFYTVYLTPGSETHISEGDSVIITGTYANENKFIKENPFIGHISNGVVQYSDEWIVEMNKYVDGLVAKLNQAGFDQSFTNQQTLYYRWSAMRQMLTGPDIVRAFSNKEVALSENYYNFLDHVALNDSAILSLPKYFDTMLELFERMEKEQKIAIEPYKYMAVYGKKITEPTLRSQFLVDLLSFTFKLGYNDHFTSHVDQLDEMITTPYTRSELPILLEKHKKATEYNKEILAGKRAPSFEAVDAKGKTIKSDDLKDKVIVIDFWYTGCIPCRAEMPHLERIAHEMEGQPIQFISMSLDKGEKYVELWRSMVKDKSDTELHLNLPGGFKADLVKHYLIKGVPRIVIIDKEGKIVTAFASRPSNPKLKVQLEQLLAAK